MASMHCTMFSEVLGRSVSLNVIIPERDKSRRKSKYQVLYLLHGLTDNCDIWVKNGIENYAKEFEIAVVMPDAQRSFYCDMVYGDDYYRHISSEIVSFCEDVFPLSSERKDVYIAGNSMGGYGAYKIALKNPEKFSKAAALSGVVDIRHMIKMFPEYQKDWLMCFGKGELSSSEDLYYLLEQSLESKNIVQMFQYCGTQDYLYEDNILFHKYCIEHHFDLQYSEDGGGHDWNSWTRQLPQMMKWLKSE